MFQSDWSCRDWSCWMGMEYKQKLTLINNHLRKQGKPHQVEILPSGRAKQMKIP